MRKNYLLLTLLGTSVLASGQAGAMNIARAMNIQLAPQDHNALIRNNLHEVRKDQNGYSFAYNPEVTQKGPQKLGGDWQKVEKVRQEQLEILGQINAFKASLDKLVTRLSQANDVSEILNGFKELGTLCSRDARKVIDTQILDQKKAVEALRADLLENHSQKVVKKIIKDLNKGRNTLKTIMSEVNQKAPNRVITTTQAATQKSRENIQMENGKKQQNYEAEISRIAEEQEAINHEIQQRLLEKGLLEAKHNKNLEKKKELGDLKQRTNDLNRDSRELEESIKHKTLVLKDLINKNKQNQELNNPEPQVNPLVTEEEKPDNYQSRDNSFVTNSSMNSIPYDPKDDGWNQATEVLNQNKGILENFIKEQDAQNKRFQDVLAKEERDLQKQRNELESLKNDLANIPAASEIEGNQLIDALKELYEADGLFVSQYNKIQELDQEILFEKERQADLFRKIELENAARIIQENFRGYSARKAIKKETLVDSLTQLDEKLKKELETSLKELSEFSLGKIKSLLSEKDKDGEIFLKKLLEMFIGAINDNAEKNQKLLGELIDAYGTKEEAVIEGLFQNNEFKLSELQGFQGSLEIKNWISSFWNNSYAINKAQNILKELIEILDKKGNKKPNGSMDNAAPLAIPEKDPFFGLSQQLEGVNVDDFWKTLKSGGKFAKKLENMLDLVTTAFQKIYWDNKPNNPHEHVYDGTIFLEIKNFKDSKQKTLGTQVKNLDQNNEKFLAAQAFYKAVAEALQEYNAEKN